MFEDWHFLAKWTGNGVSTVAILGTFFGWFPYIAAFAAFVWYVIQIWESKTTQEWWVRRAATIKARQIAKLQAKEKLITARLLALQTVQAAKKEARQMVDNAAIEAAAVAARREAELLKNPPIKPDA